MNIPVTSKRVVLEQLHPTMLDRLEKFFADGRIKGNVAVVSGVRTKAQQQALYAKYKKGRGNLAANPNRTLQGGWKGSWHMVQLDGYGHAVDFRVTNKRAITEEDVGRIAKGYGLIQTVKSEWWHFQWRNSKRVFEVTAYIETDKNTSPTVDWEGIIAFLQEVERKIKLTPLRRGSRGAEVAVVQKLLHERGHTCVADGVFGRVTARKVRLFQRSRGLVADGVVGRQTYAALKTG